MSGLDAQALRNEYNGLPYLAGYSAPSNIHIIPEERSARRRLA
jgi:hypothetical protein